MRAEDVTDTLDLALKASGRDRATVLHKPRLLSDNGPSYMAGELAGYIQALKMSHVRVAPLHPQTQGKIERWHQTLGSAGDVVLHEGLDLGLRITGQEVVFQQDAVLSTTDTECASAL